MTRLNDKSSQIKATLLSPLFPLSRVLSCLLPLSWAHVLLLLPVLDSNRCLSPSTTDRGVFFLFWACVFIGSTTPPSVNRSSSPLLHSPAATDGHCYHVQQMSQLIEKSLSRGIHFPLTSTAAAWDEGYLCVIPAFEPQSEPILPPPTWALLSLSLSPCSRLWRPSLFTSNPPVSVSVPVAHRWLLSSSLSHSSCSHCLPASAALTLHRLISLSLPLTLSFFLPPLLAVLHSLASLFFHSTADLGEIIVGDKFLCLPLTQRKGLQLDLLAPDSLCIQASGSSLFSSHSFLLFFHSGRHPPSDACDVCMAESVCMPDAVYIG